MDGAEMTGLTLARLSCKMWVSIQRESASRVESGDAEKENYPSWVSLCNMLSA